MSSPTDPVLYQLVYSGRVRDALKPLVTRAAVQGFGPEAAAALREIDRRLKLYPQFGEPYCDLAAGTGVEWIGFVGPLAVRYVLLEELRQVWVVRPITLSKEPRRPPAG